MNILSCFLRRLKTLDMNNDIIHKLEDIAIKMNTVPLETRAIILAKISDLHIVV